MQSIRSRIFNAIIRNSHLFKLKFKKEKFDFNTSIPDFRDLCEKGAARMGKLPNGISIKQEQIEGIKAEWIIPANSNKDKVIFYMHGGGYVSGSCSDHRNIIAKFAKTCGITTFLFEYRLAPEHQYPAAVDDTIQAYKFILSKGFLPENILFAGESAGGGLCLAALLAVKKCNLPLPVAAVSISPWADLTCSGDSHLTKAYKCVSPLNSAQVFAKYYCGDHDPKDPLISPLFGELDSLPPILIYVGEDEIHYDDSIRFKDKAKKANVDITLRIGKGMLHCYPLLAPLFPEATMAMDEIGKFIRTKLNIE